MDRGSVRGDSGEVLIPSSLRILGFALLTALLLAFGDAARAASFRIVYGTPLGSDDVNARNFILDEGVTQTVSKLLNNEFNLGTELTLSLGGSRGPEFDAESNTVYMPYSFVFDIADRFRKSSYWNTNVDIYDVTRDTYVYVLLHEVSHALFTMYDLRTTGDMEKTVDALTTLLLLRYYQDGGEIVLHAATLFIARGGGDFWQEHELDRQSYNQALCMVYGSDPKRYADLKQNPFLATRGGDCVREYQRQNEVWFDVLGRFLKRPPP
ncbi:MAG: DUF4344 domain-containing metallopeptidase [Arenicellales bacterium]